MRNTSSFAASPPSLRIIASLSAWLGCCLILLPSAATAAELYKCAGDGDIPVYQNMPCEPGKEIRNMSDDDTLSIVPMALPTPPTPPAVTPPPQPPAMPPPLPTTPEPAPASVPPAPPVDATIAFPPAHTDTFPRMDIKPGMTAAEVEAKLGPAPMVVDSNSNTPNLPVRWVYFPNGSDSITTTIVLQNGRVTSVDHKPVKND